MVLQLPGLPLPGHTPTILLTHRAISAVQFEHVVSVPLGHVSNHVSVVETLEAWEA
jgi:hypothetical protein